MLAFFRALQPEDWQQTVYSDGSGWTVRQLLAHFVATEAGFGGLVDDILDGGSGTGPDFNIDEYNERHVGRLAGLSAEELLDRYAELRASNAARVAALQPGDLERSGRHPFLGMAPMVDIIKLIYRHNGIHQRDIRKTLKA